MAALYSSSHTTHTPHGGTKFVIKWRVKLYPIIPTRNDARRRHFFPPEQQKNVWITPQKPPPPNTMSLPHEFSFQLDTESLPFLDNCLPGLPKINTFDSQNTHFHRHHKKNPFLFPFSFPFFPLWQFEQNETKRKSYCFPFSPFFDESSSCPLRRRRRRHDASSCYMSNNVVVRSGGETSFPPHYATATWPMSLHKLNTHNESTDRQTRSSSGKLNHSESSNAREKTT